MGGRTDSDAGAFAIFSSMVPAAHPIWPNVKEGAVIKTKAVINKAYSDLSEFAATTAVCRVTGTLAECPGQSTWRH